MINQLAGVRRTSPVITLAAAGNANAQQILAVSSFASMVGIKTFVIRRIKIQNNAAGNSFVHFGTGAAGAVVDIIPALWSLNNTTDDYEEGDLPSVEVLASIMAYPDAVAAGGGYLVQIEVEERG